MYHFIRDIYHTVIPEFLRRFMYWHGNLSKMRHIQNREPFLTFIRKEIIFIHIPKTGGISIAFSFFGLEISSHSTYHNYVMLLGKKRLSKMVVFAFVRNPWDRIHSAYYYLKSQNPDTKLGKKVEKELYLYRTFESFVLEWLCEKNLRVFPHFIPQTAFISNHKGKLEPDYIGRYEYFSDHLNRIAKILDLNFDICHLNAGPSGKNLYKTEYTEKMINKVASIYSRDIELLGYTFDNITIENKLIVKIPGNG